LVVQLAFETMWCLPLAGVVLLVVHAHHHGDVFVLSGGRDHDLLGAGGQVAARLLLVHEQARGLDHDIDAEVLPRQLGRALRADDLDVLVVDDEHVGLGLVGRRLLGTDAALELALNRVVLEEVREVVGGHDVADRHHVEILAEAALGVERAEHQAANASEPVDRNASRHENRPYFA
jgi:hypothetical protein